jgi:DEAD/DEAH box helicase domain-containing protein
MHSFAEAVRRGAQAELDIDPSEISVGLQGRRVDGVVSANIYLADTLENGAGYATELGSTDRFLGVVTGIADDLAARWSSESHAGCDAACPDCLRSYDNRHLHPLLDWKLATDVAELCLGRSLSAGRWLDLATPTAEQFAATFGEALGGVSVREAGDLCCVTAGRRAVVLGHPLWRVDPEGWNARQQRAVAELADDYHVSVVDLRGAVGYPEGVYARLA